MQEMRVQSLTWEDPLEKEMVTHSSILAWEIPWTEEPGRLWSPWGCKRVGHDLVTTTTITFSSLNLQTQYIYSFQNSAGLTLELKHQTTTVK